ncbi:MAG: DEAD/DEAH box helicase, partial [Burkholderiales bacterium]
MDSNEPQAQPEAAPIPVARPQTRTTDVKFKDFPLPEPLLRAIDDLGFQFCTPIQAQSLKITLQGHDITGKAQTGT